MDKHGDFPWPWTILNHSQLLSYCFMIFCNQNEPGQGTEKISWVAKKLRGSRSIASWQWIGPDNKFRKFGTGWSSKVSWH
jgi:hypothetical protein